MDGGFGLAFHQKLSALASSATPWFTSELEPTHSSPAELSGDIRSLMAGARRQNDGRSERRAYPAACPPLLACGQRTQLEVLRSERGACGEQIAVTLSRQLIAEYGRGYSEKNLRRTVQLAESSPETKA